MKAERAGNGFRLTGAKQFVTHGHVADLILVAARTAGAPDDAQGVTLFAIDKDAAGLTADPAAARRFEHRRAARVRRRRGRCRCGDRRGRCRAATVLGALLAAGRTGASAEMLGVGGGAMELTVAYLQRAQAVRHADRQFPGAPASRRAPLFGDGGRPRRSAQGAAIARCRGRMPQRRFRSPRR